MADYTYQDMLRMQEEAAERVREMKKRATLVMDDEKPVRQTKPLPDEVRHISYPVDLSELRRESDREVTEIPKQKKTGFLDSLAGDKESLMILAIIFILSREKEDHITTFLLMYLLL